MDVGEGCLVRSIPILDYQRPAYDAVSKRLGVSVREFSSPSHSMTNVAPAVTQVRENLRKLAVAAHRHRRDESRAGGREGAS